MKFTFFHFLILAVLAPVAAALATPILPVETTTAGFVGMAAQGPLDQPVIINNYQEFIDNFGSSTEGLDNPYLAPSVAGFFANGGVRLAVVRVGAIDDNTVIGIDGGVPGSRTGLHALLDVDEVSTVAIPGVGTPAVQAAMIAHCENTGNRMAILDPESSDDLEAIQTQRAGLSTDMGYAALYFPWIQAAPAGTTLLLPPSGFVAGNHAAHEPPDSPVGVIVTATGVAYDLTSGEQDILNAQNINGIRDLAGIRIWGARTLSNDIEWRYVAVRRMAIFIEESVRKGTEWCLSEPNDQTLWTVLRQDMEDFMNALYLAAWFQGAQQSEAYFVECGLSITMTPLDILQGRTILKLGFAPTQPSEFVILQIVHQREDLSAVPGVALQLLELKAPAPNPFNPRTTLRFSLAVEAPVSLHIFDAAGRLVRTLLNDQTLAAGDYQRRWDGRDDGGRAVGSGVYLVRLQGNGEMQSRRMVLVR